MKGRDRGVAVDFLVVFLTYCLANMVVIIFLIAVAANTPLFHPAVIEVVSGGVTAGIAARWDRQISLVVLSSGLSAGVAVVILFSGRHHLDLRLVGFLFGRCLLAVAGGTLVTLLMRSRREPRAEAITDRPDRR